MTARPLRLATVALATFLATAPAAAQDIAGPRERTISVTGSADVQVAPDRAELALGVESKDPSLAVATRDNDARVRRVLAFLRDKGIPEERIQTDYISIVPVYDPHESRRLDHYQVRKTITASVSDLPGFDALLTGAVERGITHVLDVTFRTTELRRHRDEARTQATRAAREKAEKMAAALGARVGPVTQLRDNVWGGWYPAAGSGWERWQMRGAAGGFAQNVVMNAGGGGSGEDDGTIATGRVKVSATVEATFRLE
jgi:uncharacterized protein YggE